MADKQRWAKKKKTNKQKNGHDHMNHVKAEADDDLI